MFVAPLDIVLSEYNVVQPDVLLFRQQRRHLVRDWEVTRAAPDVAVEVLSERTEARDRGRTMELLAHFGVPEYWIVDPAAETIEIYAVRDGVLVLALAAGSSQHVESPTLEGLSFPASRLFTA